MFSIAGITDAVLLVFVAMLTWEEFNRAKAGHLAMSPALAFSGAEALIRIVARANPFRSNFRVPTAPLERALTQIVD